MAQQAEQKLLEPFFRDLKQQSEVNTLGMWVFLVTETMLFGGIFLAYAVYFLNYPTAFTAASHELNLVLAGINTAILLTSSFTVAMAIRSIQVGNKRLLLVFLIVTLILGATFLGLKAFEYFEEWEHNLIPGINFMFPEPALASKAQLFMGLYFAATGLHAIHMIVGSGVLTLLIYRAWQGVYHEENYDVVENFGLYWHFVDIAWIFIFPLFYLIDRASQGG